MAKQSKPKVKVSRDKGLHTRVVFLTDEDQAGWLQAQSESTGAPVANIIRRAVEMYRQAEAKK